MAPTAPALALEKDALEVRGGAARENNDTTKADTAIPAFKAAPISSV
jgi:hypothetical protein